MNTNDLDYILPKDCRVPYAGSSDGAQPKYFHNNTWFKKDLCGGEGYSEFLATLA